MSSNSGFLFVFPKDKGWIVTFRQKLSFLNLGTPKQSWRCQTILHWWTFPIYINNCSEVSKNFSTSIGAHSRRVGTFIKYSCRGLLYNFVSTSTQSKVGKQQSSIGVHFHIQSLWIVCIAKMYFYFSIKSAWIKPN